jgi:arylsulfatase A-like enzyme
MKLFSHYIHIFIFSLAMLCASAAEKPNVVLVITDDQGYGDLGCHGNPTIKTPHMDALAAESSQLKDYHVAPTCSPSRAALLTGHWTNRTGVWHTIRGRSMLRTNEVTIAQLLEDNGYTTGMFGKWHLGDNYPYRPQDRGFTEAYYHGGGGVGQTPDYWNNSYYDGHYFHNGKPVPAKGFCTNVFFEQANGFIRKCAKEKKPFFAYISTNAPHGPWHCPPKYMSMYGFMPPVTQAFFGMITNIDENLGKTRELLKELGIADNTIFIFTTDNGTAGGSKIFNAGMRGAKGSEYDGGHRVPFFMHWPKGGMDKKNVSTEITHAVDIVPTLLDLTGSKSPENHKFDGTSIRPLLDPMIDADWPERMLVTDSQRVVDPIKWRKSAVMSNRWRLINGIELYDMKADPGQKKDIAKSHPKQLEKMRAFYDAWWAELEPTFAETTEIHIGHPAAPKVTLTAHDWLAGERTPPWSQAQIRWGNGLIDRKTGEYKPEKYDHHWAVKVITPGTYEISVMRYPAEAKKPINGAVAAGENVPGASRAYRANKGVAFPITEAVLKIDGKEIARQAVGRQDTKITFTAELKKGSIKLAPVFLTEGNGEVGTYYAVVRKK